MSIFCCANQLSSTASKKRIVFNSTPTIISQCSHRCSYMKDDPEHSLPALVPQYQPFLLQNELFFPASHNILSDPAIFRTKYCADGLSRSPSSPPLTAPLTGHCLVE